jgi:hypothetical protein
MKKILLLAVLCFTVALTHGQQWNDVGGGADYQVRCFYHDTISNKLYIGGYFEHLGGNSVNQVGIWDGINWSAVGPNMRFTNNSLTGIIETITQFNGDLIVAGVFDSVGGIAAKNIARWNGSSWSSMGNGFDDLVEVLHVFNGELYAGGEFNHSGSDLLNKIAKWDGSNWISLGSGFDNTVFSMTIFNGNLIISGLFTGPNLSSVNGSVVGWDGSNWLTMNGYFNSMVIVVANIRDTLFAGGSFTSIPNNPSNYLSRFDDLNQIWQAMPYPGGGTQPWITDIVTFHNDIYVCGYFTTPNDIAKLNGLGYDSLGNATGFIKKMIVYNNELYVAGGFSSINGTSFSNIARFSINDGIINLTEKKLISIYPNPISINEELNFELDGVFEPIEVTFFDNKGAEVSTLKLNSQDHKVNVPPNLKAGIYLLSIVDKKKYMQPIKLILNR